MAGMAGYWHADRSPLPHRVESGAGAITWNSPQTSYSYCRSMTTVQVPAIRPCRLLPRTKSHDALYERSLLLQFLL